MSYSGRNPALSKATATAATIGAQIFKEAREAKGYSMEDLAVTCGLTVEEIRRVELGKDASPSYRRRVASALGLPPGLRISA